MTTEPSRRRAFWVPDDLWLAAVAAAKERNESLSEEIRRFLRRYVRRSK